MAFRALALLFLALPAWGAEVAGVKIEDRVRVGAEELVLNGAGLRKRFVFQVYAIGLYLPQKTSGAPAVLQAPGTKRIAIHMLREVEAGQFVDALKDGIRDNLGETEMRNLEPQVAQLASMMNDVKAAKPGMVFTLDWLPSGGTLLSLNGKALGAPIPGDAFYRALLRIWLGDKPVQDDLKSALAG